MTNAEMNTLVLKDTAGQYCLVPLATIEQGRVLEEHKAEVERLIMEQPDTHGYLGISPIWTPVAVIVTGVVAIVQETTGVNIPAEIFKPIVTWDDHGMHVID
jgi:hypothetical protein